MSARPVKVSVIVPVYNVEKYLSACLNSCIHQTLNDIEIICVNDGSTDNSRSILQAFAERDYRIKIVDKPNGGLASARNAGIHASCGDILMFLDSDDYLSANACERVWQETLEAPTDVVIFGTDIFPAKPRAEHWYYQTLTVSTRRYWEFTPDLLFKNPNAKPFVWRQAFSRKLFSEHNLEFDERVRYGEDMVFQMEALPHETHFSFIGDKLYHYRWYREGSLMNSFCYDKDEKIEQHLYFTAFITEYWKNQGWLESYGKEYVQWLLEFLVADIRSAQVQYSDKHLRSLKELLQKYDIEQYLSEMPASVRVLARTVKRGKV